MKGFSTLFFLLIAVCASALECQDGYLENKITNKCVPCDPGYYHHKNINMCVPCGFGEYSYKRGSSNCVKCHKRYSTTTYSIGSTSCENNIVIENISKTANKMIKYFYSFF